MKVRIFILCCAAVTMAACGGSSQSSSTSSSGTHDHDHDHGEIKKIISAKVFIKPEKVDAFIAATSDVIEKSRAEAGNISYSLYQDPQDNTKFLFFEEWKNQDAVDFHFTTEHFQNFGAISGDLSSSPSIIIIHDCIDHDHGDIKKIISAYVFIQPEKVETFIAAAGEIVEKSCAEAGNISYKLYQDPQDNTKFLFFEEWKNQDAVDFHFATEHFQKLGEYLNDFSSAPAAIIIHNCISEKEV